MPQIYVSPTRASYFVKPHRNSTRHAGYKASQKLRERIEEVFGWTKSSAGLRDTKHRGLGRVGWQFTFALTLIAPANRLPKIEFFIVSPNI